MSVNARSMTEFFCKYPDDVTIKMLNEWEGEFTADLSNGFSKNHEPSNPCVVFSFCNSCFDDIIMLVADLNKLTYNEAKERSCSDQHELLYFHNFNKKKRCDYCLLKGCFARIVRFVFLSLDDKCVLARNRIF